MFCFDVCFFCMRPWLFEFDGYLVIRVLWCFCVRACGVRG